MVVESPTRALVLRRVVGPSVRVLATGGAVFDGRGAPRRGGGRVLQELQAAARDAGRVLIATDPDREGEAIAAGLLRFLAPAFPGRARRVVLDGDTAEAVTRALSAPGAVDRGRLTARSLRDELDRRFLAVTGRVLGEAGPCGRVQAAALALVVERSREEAPRFVVEVSIELPEGRVLAEVEPAPRSREEAEELAASLARYPLEPAAIQRRRFEEPPPPPFDTAALLAEADRLGLGPERVLEVAVRLHRGVELADGIEPLLSYPRTDETALEAEGRPLAHGAIRPVSREWPPERASPLLGAAERKVYERVWRRTAAALASPALLDEVVIALEGDRRARAVRVIAPGWRAEELPAAAAAAQYTGGQGGNAGAPRLGSARIAEHPGVGPLRPGELVAALAEQGVGRPSTWAAVARSLREAGWVSGERGRLVATEEGYRVAGLLGESLGGWPGPGGSMAIAEGLRAVEEARLAPAEFRRRFIAPLDAACAPRGPRCPSCSKPLVGGGPCAGFPLCRGAVGAPSPSP